MRWTLLVCACGCVRVMVVAWKLAVRFGEARLDLLLFEEFHMQIGMVWIDEDVLFLEVRCCKDLLSAPRSIRVFLSLA